MKRANGLASGFSWMSKLLPGNVPRLVKREGNCSLISVEMALILVRIPRAQIAGKPTRLCWRSCTTNIICVACEKVWKNKNQTTNSTKLCTTSNIKIKCTTVCQNSENVTENNYIICVST